MKVEGANIPRVKRGEDLYTLFIKLMLDLFDIRVTKLDIAEIRRFSSSRRSPILVK